MTLPVINCALGSRSSGLLLIKRLLGHFRSLGSGPTSALRPRSGPRAGPDRIGPETSNPRKRLNRSASIRVVPPCSVKTVPGPPHDPVEEAADDVGPPPTRKSKLIAAVTAAMSSGTRLPSSGTRKEVKMPLRVPQHQATLGTLLTGVEDNRREARELWHQDHLDIVQSKFEIGDHKHFQH